MSAVGLIGMPLTCIVLGIGLLVAIAYLYRTHSKQVMAIEVFVLSFLLRVAFIFINENYQIFEHKVAGERSLELYQKYLLGIGNLHGFYDNMLQMAKEQFALQTFLNAPFFAIFGESLMTILFTNAFFSSLIGSIAAIMLLRPYGPKVASRALLLFMIYPASINFSLFGLRDPLIFFFMTIFAVAAMLCYVDFARRFHMFVALVGCAGLLLLRPELAYVPVALTGLLLFPNVLNLVDAEQRPVERLAVVGLFGSVACVIVVALAIVSLKVAAVQIGASSINPADFAGERAVERFERAEDADFGGGSHLMSGDTYRNLPIYYRVPIQTLGLIVLPFPWMIAGAPQALAFLDSLLLMFLMLLAWKYSYGHTRYRVVSWALLMSFCVGILGMGFIVSNAGNGFRMRFGVVPLCLLAASFSRVVPTFRLRADD